MNTHCCPWMDGEVIESAVNIKFRVLQLFWCSGWVPDIVAVPVG